MTPKPKDDGYIYEDLGPDAEELERKEKRTRDQNALGCFLFIVLFVMLILGVFAGFRGNLSSSMNRSFADIVKQLNELNSVTELKKH